MDAAVARGDQLEAILRKQSGVVEVTGAGLMRGAELDGPYATQVVAAGREAGFILNATGPSRLRFVPPLVVTAADLDALDAALPAVLDAARDAAQESASGPATSSATTTCRPPSCSRCSTSPTG